MTEPYQHETGCLVAGIGMAVGYGLVTLWTWAV